MAARGGDRDDEGSAPFVAVPRGEPRLGNPAAGVSSCRRVSSSPLMVPLPQSRPVTPLDDLDC